VGILLMDMKNFVLNVGKKTKATKLLFGVLFMRFLMDFLILKPNSGIQLSHF